jgi:hypothetical protein
MDIRTTRPTLDAVGVHSFDIQGPHDVEAVPIDPGTAETQFSRILLLQVPTLQCDPQGVLPPHPSPILRVRQKNFDSWAQTDEGD